jgi:hypothetical protein
MPIAVMRVLLSSSSAVSSTPCGNLVHVPHGHACKASSRLQGLALTICSQQRSTRSGWILLISRTEVALMSQAALARKESSDTDEQPDAAQSALSFQYSRKRVARKARGLNRRCHRDALLALIHLVGYELGLIPFSSSPQP